MVFFLWRCDPKRVMASSFLRFLDHTQRCNTVGKTPLDEWWARRRDFYLTTHNPHNRQTSMPPVGFEPTISAGERPQTHGLDRVATGTGTLMVITSCKYKRQSIVCDAILACNYNLVYSNKCGWAIQEIGLRPLACWVCGFESSRRGGGMHVCRLWLMCVVR